MPLGGAAMCAFLLRQLDAHALTDGGIRFVLGFVVLAWLTRGFREHLPETGTEET